MRARGASMHFWGIFLFIVFFLYMQETHFYTFSINTSEFRDLLLYFYFSCFLLYTLNSAHLNNIWPQVTVNEWLQQSEVLPGTVFSDTLTVLLRKAGGQEASYRLLLSLVQPVPPCVGGQPETCNLSLFSTFGVIQNWALHYLRLHFNASDSVSAPGRQPPPTSSSVTSRKRKRDVSAG